MSPDDPRHGTNAGFLTHERDHEPPCATCRRGRLRMKKSIALDKLSGKRLTYTANEVLEVISPWLDMGISVGAIVSAAGYESQRSGHLQETFRRDGYVRRATLAALAGVTEDDFSDNHKVNADLTRRRIYSLMAAGHRQCDIPVNPKGQWRGRERVSIGVAREVRTHYRANEAVMGSALHTMARARNAGHRPPLAWDDPDTLGWVGKPPRQVTAQPSQSHDEAVVFRILSRDFPPSLPAHATRSERIEVVHRWPDSHAELGRLTGWNVDRYTKDAS